VRSVWARAQALRAVGSHDDDVLAALEHVNGAGTLLSASLLAADAGPRFRVLGTAGAALLPHPDTQEDLLRAGQRPGPDGQGWGAQPGLTARVTGEATGNREVAYVDGQWPAFYRGVRDCLVSGGQPPVGAVSALATMTVLDAIGEAARTGRTIATKGAGT